MNDPAASFRVYSAQDCNKDAFEIFWRHYGQVDRINTTEYFPKVMEFVPRGTRICDSFRPEAKGYDSSQPRKKLSYREILDVYGIEEISGSDADKSRFINSTQRMLDEREIEYVKRIKGFLLAEWEISLRF